jgi:hypothetical protein
VPATGCSGAQEATGCSGAQEATPRNNCLATAKDRQLRGLRLQPALHRQLERCSCSEGKAVNRRAGGQTEGCDSEEDASMYTDYELPLLQALRHS